MNIQEKTKLLAEKVMDLTHNPYSDEWSKNNLYWIGTHPLYELLRPLSTYPNTAFLQHKDFKPFEDHNHAQMVLEALRDPKTLHRDFFKVVLKLVGESYGRCHDADEMGFLLLATPTQKMEAVGLVLGLWKEGE